MDSKLDRPRGVTRPHWFSASVIGLLTAGLLSLAWVPAEATAPSTVRSEDGHTSPTQSTSTGNCVAYANGTTMGSYCNSGSGPAIGTLQQRFGGQDFRPCRYTDPPDGVYVPPNQAPDKGRWWMQTCLREIDWDTISGGSGKRLSMQLVWMPHSSDTSYDNPNPLEDWLWDVVIESTQYPVPYLRPKPNYVPLVGVPAYFEIGWFLPETIATGKKETMRDPAGPYADLVGGGPFVQTRNGDLTMRAIATDVTIDPMQEDMQPFSCDKGVPVYHDDEPPIPAEQGPNSCHVTFKRSSAVAEAKSTHPIPDDLGEVYYLKVEVTWKVTYGNGEDDMHELGDGFTMVSFQPVPVREVQAPNIPPVMIF